MEFFKGNLLIVLLLGWIQFYTPLLAQSSLTHCTFQEPRLGTTITCNAYLSDSLDAHIVESEFFELLDSLNLIFSDYIPDSEINDLCRAGYMNWIKVSGPLFDLLTISKKITRYSDNQFDITMGSLSHLWRKSTQQGQVPSKKQIRKALNKVGFENIWLDTSEMRVQLRKKDMQLDFGGIAKGYLGDQLAQFLRSRNIQSYLIDLGGDLVVGDAPPGKASWKIQVPNLDTTFMLTNMAIATSGPDYQFFDYKGKRYSHILDPQTGWGISTPFSSTVLAQKGYLADALASAFSLMNRDECLALSRKFPEIAYFLQKDDHIHQRNDNYHTE